MRLHTRSKNKLLSGITIFLILSMVVYLGFTFAFLHLHVIDGRVVVHSHYSGSSNKASQQAHHSHSNLQFLHHCLTSVFDKLLVTVISVMFLAALVLIFSMISDESLSPSSIYLSYLNRAPPALAFSPSTH